VTSHKRRITSKSGASGKSQKKDTSSRTEPSWRTAPASFEAVFGKAQKLDEALTKLIAQQQRTEATLREAQQEKPTLALYRTRHTQRLARLRRYLEELREAIRHRESEIAAQDNS